MIIDAHQHFWKYSPTKHAWIGEEMSVLKRDFLPSDLSNIYERNSVKGCVAVQADGSEEETEFLLQLASENDFIKGVVGWVYLQDKNVEARLHHYQSFKKLKGFRHVVQDEPDPNFMLRNDFRAGLKALEGFDYTYDILIYPHQLDAAIKTVQDFPGIKFVLDHIAKPDIKNSKMDDWLPKIKTLAQSPNIYCKVSGMVTEAAWKSWRQEDFAPYLEAVTAAFGIERLMFGSDWPVCLLSGNYEEVLGIVKTHMTRYSTADQEQLFYKNALSFYRLERGD
jgi:L-fuconolactonase